LKRFSVAVISILIALLVVESGFYFSLQSRYEALSAEYSSLQADYSRLQSFHYELQENYSVLLNSFLKLQSDYDSLRNKYAELEGSYNSLKLEYSFLSEKYSELENQYNLLKKEYDFFMENYRWLVREVNKRLGHDWELYRELITPNDPEVQRLVIEITGGWSGFGYDWSEFWSEIKSMYDWIVNNIEYRYDGLHPELPSIPGQSIVWYEEMYQLPSETLRIRKGDCDDMAILLLSMIRFYVNQTYTAYIIIIHSEKLGHAAVVIPVSSGKICIVDPAGKYYTKTWNGKITQKDVEEEINNWFNYWFTHYPDITKLKVTRIFNEKEKIEFKSTQDFITWIYNTTITTTPRKL